jgi:hypothetical protein
MALGPQKLLEPTKEDLKAVDAIEKYVDESSQIQKFDGGEIRIPIPPELFVEHLAIRMNVRYGELRTRYKKAGWKEIALNGSGNQRVLVLNQYERRSSGSLGLIPGRQVSHFKSLVQ